ncbi:MAG: type I glyceraldehyde-3-phosphate dehydrogenase [Longimicrobiales bacterium]
MTRVAINGFGRIGRAVFKILAGAPGLELVAVNDVAPPEELAYLLEYDSVYGRYEKSVHVENGYLVVEGVRYPVFGERDPGELPWRRLQVGLVFECTGIFNRRSDLEKHIRAGAGYVILSAPSKDDDISTVVHGVNTSDGETRIISCASCTTNCITPVAEIMDRRVGVRKATMTTVHAYTSSQAIVDAPAGKDRRRGRAAAVNLVPTSTGAARATTRALPGYEGRFDGVAVRAPVPVGSLADIVFLTARPTTVEELNDIFRREAESDRYKGILGVSEDPIVSSDVIRDPRASIVDLGLTQVVDGDLVKVMSWYDNEWGYANQLVREARQARMSAGA